jgi:hypothetical protein
MFTIVVIIVALLLALLVIGALWNSVRPSANFNLVYIRALRIEGSKEVAITAALEHLRTFLAPFDQLSDNQIATVARLFSDVDEPHKALQPVIQQAERAKSLTPYMDEKALQSWKEIWLKNR